MKIRIYNFLVNRNQEICERYHNYHDKQGRVGKIFSWFYLIMLNIIFVFKKDSVGIENEIDNISSDTDIHSERVKYSEYRNNHNWYETSYWKEITTASIIHKSIFLNFNEKAENEFIVAKVKKLLLNDYKVYLLDRWQDLFNPTDNIFYINRESAEYFKMLCNVENIYTEICLHNYFVKNNKQFVIFNAEYLDRQNLDERIEMDSLYGKSDCEVNSNEEASQIIDKLIAGEKKNIGVCKKAKLVIINSKYFKDTLKQVFLLLGEVDFNQENLCILLTDVEIDRNYQILEQMDNRIKIIVKKGKFLSSADVLGVVNFLNDEKDFVSSLEETEKYIGQNAFRKEKERLFGNTEFSYVMNVGQDSMYWRLLVKSICENSVFWDINNSILKAKTAIINNLCVEEEIYKEIYFSGIDDLEKVIHAEGLVKCQKEKLFLIPCIDSKDNEKKCDLVVNGQPYIFIKDSLDEYSGRTRGKFVRKDDQNIVFICVHSLLSYENLKEYVSKQCKIGKTIVLLDYLHRMANDSIKQLQKYGSIIYISDFAECSSLLDYAENSKVADNFMEKNMGIKSVKETQNCGSILVKLERLPYYYDYIILPWNLSRDEANEYISKMYINHRQLLVFDFMDKISQKENVVLDDCPQIQIIKDYFVYVKVKGHLGQKLNNTDEMSGKLINGGIF